MCLLGELTFYKTESGASYAVSLRPIIQARFRHGLPPPHIITDNPSVLEGVLDPLMESVWWYSGLKYILAGDHTHREIEFLEAVDSAHQDSGCDIRDFSYIIRRFPHMVEGDTYDDIRKCVRKLEECDFLYRRRRSKQKDPYAANRPYNKGRRGNSTIHDFCTRFLSRPKGPIKRSPGQTLGIHTR